MMIRMITVTRAMTIRTRWIGARRGSARRSYRRCGPAYRITSRETWTSQWTHAITFMSTSAVRGWKMPRSQDTWLPSTAPSTPLRCASRRSSATPTRRDSRPGASSRGWRRGSAPAWTSTASRPAGRRRCGRCWSASTRSRRRQTSRTPSSSSCPTTSPPTLASPSPSAPSTAASPSSTSSPAASPSTPPRAGPSTPPRGRQRSGT
mmetsp:Transcript_8318/g.17843  ORF Transcript_8318/g.17843 Transcript_8318/m.17843 type:complete len:206 (-) Transcript_8318:11-628(-)